MPFGVDFEPDTGNSGSMLINYHCSLIRRSYSKERYAALEVPIVVLYTEFWRGSGQPESQPQRVRGVR